MFKQFISLGKNQKALFRDKRFYILSISLIGLALYFWIFSRYPALNTKEMMSSSIILEDLLSFNAHTQKLLNPKWWEAILVTYTNWIYTNKQGMLFGLSFAVLLMTFLSLIKPLLSHKKGSFFSSLMGLFMGVPLGVCVNCAAPIAYGLYTKGSRIETALAMMISSPTLNIVVVSMMLTLFPFYMVMIKLVLIVIVILIVMPLLARKYADEIVVEKLETELCETNMKIDDVFMVENSMYKSFLWILKELLHNIGQIFFKVVPIMFLAGFLGAVVINLLPWDTLVSTVSEIDVKWALLVMIAIAMFGLFLPVPIAFDVIIVMMMMNAKLPMLYASTILFVLGSFSIYSYMVIRKAGAKKIANALALTLIVFAILSGVLTDYADKIYKKYIEKEYYSKLITNDTTNIKKLTLKKSGKIIVNAPKMNWQYKDTNIKSMQLLVTDTSTGEWKMIRQNKSGFEKHKRSFIHEVLYPYEEIIVAIASGDTNKDDWQDILVGTTTGLYLYLNNGITFQKVDLPAEVAKDELIVNAALVDMDNNSYPDIVYSVFKKGMFISYNKNGNFQKPIKLNIAKSYAHNAFAFGDLNHNGELDIVVGNHNLFWENFVSGESSRDEILMQTNQTFNVKKIPGITGETMSILLSDINDDSYLDLLIANDYDEPDNYFWGKKDGEFVSWKAKDINLFTYFTMSLDSGDINNDLRLDTFHAQITGRPLPKREIQVIHKASENDCDENSKENDKQCSINLFRGRRGLKNISICDRLREEEKLDCIASISFYRAILSDDNGYEKYLSKQYVEILETIKWLKNAKQIKHEDNDAPIDKQIKTDALLYVQDEKGTLKDEAKLRGVTRVGWAWNTKFKDFDGDGYLDIFAVNGTNVIAQDTENVLYKNIKGQKFVNYSPKLGLDDFDVTACYTTIDYDNDGDLDIVTFNIAGEIKLYKNAHTHKNHLQVELEDSQGNKSGIGSKIIIYYGKNASLHQLREIKLSGGSHSFDAPIVHFGLGKYAEVEHIEVRWSTGEKNSYKGPFETGKRYKIYR